MKAALVESNTIGRTNNKTYTVNNAHSPNNNTDVTKLHIIHIYIVPIISGYITSKM